MSLPTEGIESADFTGTINNNNNMKKLIITAAILMAATQSYSQDTHTSSQDAHSYSQDDSELMTINLAPAEVTGTRAPLPADKAVRLIQVLDRKAIEASSAQSVNDLLKMVAGADVRQRGAFGIQTDISVNGGTEDQLTVLLNGINISNPHTGHFSFDLPVSVDDIERIEVIEGGASRIYGCQAFSGAINIVTRTDSRTSLGAHAYGGSYGTAGANSSLTLATGDFNNRVSGGYTRSDGGTYNDDFNKACAYWRGRYDSPHLKAALQAGLSTMNYGANTFYGTGSDSQYEENRRYLVAASAEYAGRVNVPVQLYWNRSLDHYVWMRANPAAYQNFHQTNVYGANAGANTSWALGKTAIGLELRRENILSTRLGKELPEGEQHKVPGHDEYYKYKDGRTNLGLYLEHNVLIKDVTISLGLLANHNTSVSGGMRLYPGADISWRLGQVKLYASFNQSLRTPTFTDLYYNGPGLAGNSSLKPEKSTDWHIGASFTASAVTAQVKGFYRKGTDMIDWVRKKGESAYSTANSDIDNIGAEMLASADLARLLPGTPLRHLTVGYCYNHQRRVNSEQESAYASGLTFLRHKLTASLQHHIASRLDAHWNFTLKNRHGQFDNAQTGQRQRYGTFATLDLKLTWTEPRYTLYLQANNLTDYAYYDFANIKQPGLWLTGGLKLTL